MRWVIPNGDDVVMFCLSLQNSSPSLYAYGIVQLQLLTEQGPLGLLSAVKEALETQTLMNLVPRLPVNAEMAAWATDFAHMALKCTQPGGAVSLETELLPELEALAKRLGNLGSSMAMSWEQVRPCICHASFQPCRTIAMASTSGSMIVLHIS